MNTKKRFNDDVAQKKTSFKLLLNLKSLKACKECLVISGQRDQEDHQRNQLFLLDKSVKKTKISHGRQWLGRCPSYFAKIESSIYILKYHSSFLKIRTFQK